MKAIKFILFAIVLFSLGVGATFYGEKLYNNSVATSVISTKGIPSKSATKLPKGDGVINYDDAATYEQMTAIDDQYIGQGFLDDDARVLAVTINKTQTQLEVSISAKSVNDANNENGTDSAGGNLLIVYDTAKIPIKISVDDELSVKGIVKGHQMFTDASTSQVFNYPEITAVELTELQR